MISELGCPFFFQMTREVWSCQSPLTCYLPRLLFMEGYSLIPQRCEWVRVRGDETIFWPDASMK